MPPAVFAVLFKSCRMPRTVWPRIWRIGIFELIYSIIASIFNDHDVLSGYMPAMDRA